MKLNKELEILLNNQINSGIKGGLLSVSSYGRIL